MEIDVDALPEDTAALQAIILAQHRQIAGIAAANRAYEALVQALKITIARLKKQRFGPSSEKIEREIEQLDLAPREPGDGARCGRSRGGPRGCRRCRGAGGAPPAPSQWSTAHRARRAARERRA